MSFNRAHLVAIAAAVAAIAIVPAGASAHPGNPFGGSNHSETLAVYGDAPYGTTPTDTAEFDATPAFIDAVNSDPKVDRVMHIGDIHSGKQYCTAAYDQAVFDLWKQFKDPLVYTPGDNEWTDCHKKAEGGGTYNATTGLIDYVLDGLGNPVDYAAGNPVANLELVRSIFFPRAGVTLGQHKAPVFSQAQLRDPWHPTDRKFVENVMWVKSGVLFATVNIPGGSNNDTDVWYGAPTASSEQLEEKATRTAADLRWISYAFTIAKALHVEGIAIGVQADMWDPEKGVAHQSEYEPFVSSIATKTAAFKKPVLLLNGDSHEYLSDNPLSASDPINYMHPGYDVSNFHRVVVHGSTVPLEYLRLTVNPRANAANGADAFGPFSWEREIQP